MEACFLPPQAPGRDQKVESRKSVTELPWNRNDWASMRKCWKHRYSKAERAQLLTGAQAWPPLTGKNDSLGTVRELCLLGVPTLLLPYLFNNPH